MSQYLESAKQGLTIPSKEEVQAGFNNGLASAQQSIGEIKNNVNSTLNEFSSASAMNASSEFLNSNSIVAKFAFLLLLLVVFMGLLKIGMMIIAYLFSPAKQPYLVKGLLQGSMPVTIRQNPADANSIVIYRSNNQSGGIEFTWTTWLNVSSLSTTRYKHSHIFNKGNNTYFDATSSNATTGGVATVNNSPGVYIDTDNNGYSTLRVIILMDVLKIVSTDGSPAEQIKLTVDIPMGQWFHLAIRVQNYNLDCYLNGVISDSVSFGDYVPKQNYDDVHINQEGGFNGSLSNLRYYDYALTANDINAIVKYGPNLTPSSLDNKPNNSYDYISTGWYSAFK
jgi:hypothetical protein